uniref:BRICHOS domain-containing protein n=1 Tax=Zosterops lateralis melanops TaxID=1220523 RepID=A0A8D2NQN3_ZOSLA
MPCVTCCAKCCARCSVCCAKCCTRCSLCCAKCCCLPKCCRCPKCPKCLKCPGCSSCSGCLKKSLCCLPRMLCALPRKLLGCCHLRCLLIVVVVVVLLVLLIAAALLMRVGIDRSRADSVSGDSPWCHQWGHPRCHQWGPFPVPSIGITPSATTWFGFQQLLVSYRPQLHRACYVTRVDKDNIPGLDTVMETFQHRQVRTWLGQEGLGGAEDKISMPLADRSLLGTTASILCGLLPVYWA